MSRARHSVENRSQNGKKEISTKKNGLTWHHLRRKNELVCVDQSDISYLTHPATSPPVRSATKSKPSRPFLLTRSDLQRGGNAVILGSTARARVDREGVEVG